MEISDYTFELIALGVYTIGLPLVIFAICALHKHMLITRRMRKMRRDSDAKNLPKPLWPKFTRIVGFAMKQDSRPLGKTPLTYRSLFWLMYLSGLIVSIAGSYFENWTVVLVGMSLFFIAIFTALGTSGKLIRQRDKIIDRIFKTVNFKMSYGRDAENNPNSVIQVKEWRNYIEPDKVSMEIPLSFNADYQDEFMRHFNQHLSKVSSESEERSWVPAEDQEKGIPGWDYGSSTVTLRTVPPLPTMAKWHENYVLNERCAWSFFPLGLSVEDGVEMINPENPEDIQNVVGIDVSGEQKDLGKNGGFYVSEKITTSPQILIGGSTGGGKSLSVDTLIPVLKNSEN